MKTTTKKQCGDKIYHEILSVDLKPNKGITYCSINYLFLTIACDVLKNLDKIMMFRKMGQDLTLL